MPGQISALGPGREFDLIRQIAERLGPVAAGLGDDCAYLPQGDQFLAISTDTSNEGIHFQREWLSVKEIGYRATAVAVSDLAAAGADSPVVLVAISAPREEDALEVMDGAGELMKRIGGSVIGGDVTRARDLSITVTAIGSTPCPMHRSGARPGDGIWLTGHLGLPRAALRRWQRGAAPGHRSRARFAHPEPRLEAGRWLVEHGATAMLDVSDGLAGDCRHLAAASGCAVAIELANLPIDAEVDLAAREEGIEPAIFAALGGEDYELLVALPDSVTDAGALFQTCGVELTRIGMCKEDRAGRGSASLTLRGAEVSLAGFDHYR